MNRRRSFLPVENSKSNNQKKMKFSSTDYADISYKFNTSATKSISTNDTDDTMSESVIELIKDFEKFNFERNIKLNEMFYPNKNDKNKVKMKTFSSSIFINDKPTNNFSFKRVFEKIQNERKLKNDKKTNISSLNSSLNSIKNESHPPRLKDILFYNTNKPDKERVNRNIRNIASLKKSRALKKEAYLKQYIKEEDYNMMDEEETTPTFTTTKFRDICILNELKETDKANFFMPKTKSSANFSLFHDLNPNQNPRYSRNKIFKTLKSNVDKNTYSEDFTLFKARPIPKFNKY